MRGEVHHFEYRGLYDGVTILADRETGTIWNHITGEAMYGPLAGSKLPTSNLLHTTVKQALRSFPDLEIAISDRPIAARTSRWSPWAEKIPILGDRLRGTMATEDMRRPTMDLGLGIWTERTRRYYPMETVVEQGSAVLDRLDGRGLVVYFDPEARALGAFYMEAESATWEEDVLRFDNGAYMTHGILYDARGAQLTIERPLQLFTRWYGFALTFPGTEIYEPSG